MLLGEPPRTAYDLHFTLLGVPIRVHPMFWLVSLLFGMNPGRDSNPARVALWIVASFVSIVVHEMGHALTIRYFGARPWITLYGMGGLASSAASRRSPRTQILISLAGPAAGFAFFVLVVLVTAATKHPIRIDWQALPDVPVEFAFRSFDSPRVYELVEILMFQNFFWTLLNLLPIYPLDGGHVAREALQVADPSQGLRRSLILSVAAAAGMAVYSLAKSRGIFMTMFFGFMAYESYVMLQRIFPGRGMGGRW